MAKQMRVKAVIMKPDHNNDAFVLRPSEVEGKFFRRNNSVYFLDSKYFQMTWARKAGWRRWYVTYYYTLGIANPLPVPDFKRLQPEQLESKEIDTRTGKDADENTPKEHRATVRFADWKHTVDLGVPGPEMAAIFNPWFYQVIGQVTRDKLVQVQFLIMVGMACAIGYLIWMHGAK